ASAAAASAWRRASASSSARRAAGVSSLPGAAFGGASAMHMHLCRGRCKRPRCHGGRTQAHFAYRWSSGGRPMSRVSVALFGAAILYALTGMLLGIVMGASEDHTLAPVHAHINLLGWASLALMGAFYGLAGDLAPVRLAWVNFAVSNLGNLITLPLLAKL